MPLNQSRVVEVALEECGKLPERYPGYRESIRRLVSDVLEAELRHAIAAGNIQQKVDGLVTRAAAILAAKEGDGK